MGTLVYEKLYLIQDVLSKVLLIHKTNGKNKKVDFDGDFINMAIDKYKCFKVKGIKCIKCGLKGSFFRKEEILGRHHPSYCQLSLYATDSKGNLVLMTKDHIIPQSKGGKNHLNNYQTMCQRCNSKKGDYCKGKL